MNDYIDIWEELASASAPEMIACASCHADFFPTSLAEQTCFDCQEFVNYIDEAVWARYAETYLSE